MPFSKFTLPVLALLLAVTAAQISAQETGVAKETERSDEAKPVELSDGFAKLVPENTRIEFIGTHVGDDKKPRLGGFQKFAGKIGFDGQQTITELEIKFDIKSLWTEFGPLTSHLLNPDFFDSEKFGSASFSSTEVETISWSTGRCESSGEFSVTGTMMMMGVEKEISFPVKLTVVPDGILLTSKFEIDRTLFGMDKKTEGVDKEVTIMVSVGHSSSPRKIGDIK